MRYFLIVWVLLVAPAAHACGLNSDCVVGDRSYRISMPEGEDAPVGAVVWSHGYGGSAAGVMRNGSLRRMVHEQGLALIAADGLGGSWNLPNGPRTMESTGEAEFAYFESIVEDAGTKFDIDQSRLVAAGFSAGGMMVWNLACARPEMFAGFVPIAGTFWLEPPQTCAPEVTSIVHIHGDRDTTVPLDGRAIAETRQGKVSEALGMYTVHGDFGPQREFVSEALKCDQQSNQQGEILEFCLFSGGHSFRTEYLAHGIERLKAVGRL